MRTLVTRRLLPALLLPLALGCTRKVAPTVADCSHPPPTATHEGGIRWYVDQFEAARACAQHLDRPLVVDLWAPWCHTCISVRETILRHPSIAAHANRYVWVALDTDRPENASTLETYPPLAWPTFYVLQPDDGAIAARFVGAPSLEQFQWILTHTNPHNSPTSTKLVAEPLLVKAHAAERERRWQVALDLYEQALAAAPKDWPRRPDILAALMRSHFRAGTCNRAFALIRKEINHTGQAASSADFADYAHRCLSAHPEITDQSELRLALEAHVGAAVTDGKEMSVDDRSDALRILRELALARGDDPKAKRWAKQQQQLLTEALQHTPRPEQAMGYNWPAAEVYVFLGEAEKLIPILEKSERDLPNAYDPPYRLAWVRLQAGYAAEALAPAHRALSLVYGPRKARVYDLIADIEKARGNLRGERAARQGTVSILETLPDGQKNPAYLASARSALEALPKESPPTK